MTKFRITYGNDQERSYCDKSVSYNIATLREICKCTPVCIAHTLSKTTVFVQLRTVFFTLLPGSLRELANTQRERGIGVAASGYSRARACSIDALLPSVFHRPSPLFAIRHTSPHKSPRRWIPMTGILQVQ